MPQRGTTVDASAFTPLVQAFTGTDPYTKGAMDRRRVDLQEERDRANIDINKQRLDLQKQQNDAKIQQQGVELQFKQQNEARAQEAAARQAAAEQRALEDQRYQEWQRKNPATAPIPPERPQPPHYDDLGTDPMQSFDTPDEVAKLGSLINQQVRPLLAAPAGQTIPADFSLPADTVRQIQDRVIQYRQSGLPLPEAVDRARGDLLGAHPTYAPGTPADAGSWNPFDWGAGAHPAVPAGIQPDTATIPPTASQPIDVSHGWQAQRTQRMKDYDQQMADYEKRRAAYEAWRPPVYPGGATTPPPQPQPGVPTVPGTAPQPQPNPAPAAATPLPKRMITKGGHTLEFD